jgi:hypothetical protein
MSIPGGSNLLLLTSAAGGGGGGYEISRSLRFNSSDSAYLSRAFDNTADNQKHTFSFWFKLSNLPSANENFFGAWVDDSYQTNCWISTTGAFNFYQDGQQAGPTGTSTLSFYGTQVLRDYSAWYHVVISIDRTQSTSTDRFKVYLNGVDITANGSTSYGDQNSVARWPGSSTSDVNIGRFRSGEPLYYNGYLADFYFIDGQALDPSSFGEFDTNGVWQPKAYAGTYGTNGFHLPFSDNSTAAALGTDTSGNGNDWTVNNIAITGGNGNYAPGITIGNFTLTGYDKNAVVDGNLSTFYADRPINGNGFIFSSIPEAQTSVRINYWTEDGTVSTNAGTLSTGANTQAWRTISTTYPFTLTSFSVTGGSGSQGFFIYAIEVDGVVLVDNIFGSNNDSLVDSPTNYGTDTGAGGEVRGNYCTWNVLGGNTSVVISNGNLDRSGSNSGNKMGTIGVRSGKWYWEVTNTNVTSSTFLGCTEHNNDPEAYDLSHMYWNTGQKITGNAASSYGASWTAGDTIGFALDCDNGTFVCYKNGISQGTLASGLTGKTLYPLSRSDGTCAHSANFGQRPFAYTAPSGFKALCTTNLPEPTIADGSTAMDVALYTGNGSTQTISGLNFSPDLVWIKKRSGSEWHCINDTVRGAELYLSSNTTNAESGASNVLTAFTSTGYTVGSQGLVNDNGFTFASWCWDAGNSTVTNTQGSITSQVRANASAGFSVVTYTGTGSAGTVGHGLGVKPDMIIIKNRSTGGYDWKVIHEGLTGAMGTYMIQLNLTDAESAASASWFNSTSPTSTVFSVGTLAAVNGSGDNYVAYCFAPVAGYSSAFSYSGNGSSDGPYTYLGFRSRFIIIKRTDTTGDWLIYDTARDSYNTMTKRLYPNLSNAEADASDQALDVTANGFKVRANNANFNASGGTYIGFAFAESPFQYARAR